VLEKSFMIYILLGTYIYKHTDLTCNSRSKRNMTSLDLNTK